MKNYRIELFEIETESGVEWVAEYPDLKGCVGGGVTPEEALSEAEENKIIYLSMLTELGKPVPKPTEKKKTSASGKLSLRLSKSMHEEIVTKSDKEGVSINQYIVEAIAEKNGRESVLDIIQKTVTTVRCTTAMEYLENDPMFRYGKAELKYSGGMQNGFRS